jgi:hypothetical protein
LHDSRSPTRKRSARRRRKVQRTFLPLAGPEDDGPQDFPVLDFKSFPYRTALANWPDEWRERWGHRANALEEEGLPWQEAESRAFFEVQEERRAEIGIQPIPLMGRDVEEN